MCGVITARHLVTCAHVIILNFGLPIYLRCVVLVVLRRNFTFLDVVKETKYDQHRD